MTKQEGVEQEVLYLRNALECLAVRLSAADSDALRLVE